MEHPLWFFSEFSGSLESSLFYRLGNKKQLEGWEGRVLYSLCCLHFSSQAMLKNSQRMEGHFLMFIEVSLHLNVFNIWSIFSFLFIGREVTIRTLNDCLQISVSLQIINYYWTWLPQIIIIFCSTLSNDCLLFQIQMLYLTTTWYLLPILQCWIPWVWKGSSSWCTHFRTYLCIILYLF